MEELLNQMNEKAIENLLSFRFQKGEESGLTSLNTQRTNIQNQDIIQKQSLLQSQEQKSQQNKFNQDLLINQQDEQEAGSGEKSKKYQQKAQTENQENFEESKLPLIQDALRLDILSNKNFSFFAETEKEYKKQEESQENQKFLDTENSQKKRKKIENKNNTNKQPEKENESYKAKNVSNDDINDNQEKNITNKENDIQNSSLVNKNKSQKQELSCEEDLLQRDMEFSNQTLSLSDEKKIQEEDHSQTGLLFKQDKISLSKQQAAQRKNTQNQESSQQEIRQVVYFYEPLPRKEIDYEGEVNEEIKEIQILEPAQNDKFQEVNEPMLVIKGDQKVEEKDEIEAVNLDQDSFI